MQGLGREASVGAARPLRPLIGGSHGKLGSQNGTGPKGVNSGYLRLMCRRLWGIQNSRSLVCGRDVVFVGKCYRWCPDRRPGRVREPRVHVPSRLVVVVSAVVLIISYTW